MSERELVAKWLIENLRDVDGWLRRTDREGCAHQRLLANTITELEALLNRPVGGEADKHFEGCVCWKCRPDEYTALALRGGEQDEAECRIHNQPKAACDEQFRLGCDPVRAAPSPGGSEWPKPCRGPNCLMAAGHDGECLPGRPTPPEVTEAQARSVRDDISRAFIKDPSSLNNIETWRSALTAALAGGK